MNRRDAACALLTFGIAPAPVWAQASARVAWVSVAPASDGGLFLNELRSGLRELGRQEGRNLVLDAYWGDNANATAEKNIAQVIAARPDVIVSQGNAVFALRKATQTIPVVFGFSGDPVEAGMVQSMARPGGNMTGISYLTMALVGKRMQLLKEVLPRIASIAVIAFPQHPGDQSERAATQAAAAALGLQVAYYEARSAGDIALALGQIEQSSHQAVMAFPVQNIIAGRERIAQWSIRTRIPVVSGWAQFAQGGNLMSYGPNLRAASFRLANFVDRILKGASPADLPVEQPVQVELVINMRTARALGITIPQSVLLRADEVIQ